MHLVSKRLKNLIQLLSATFLLATFGASSAFAEQPAYSAKFELIFSAQPSCSLSDYASGKVTEKGKGNLVINENDINWTASCLLMLPKEVSYCTLAGQKIANFDALVSVEASFQKKVLRAKITSESDINPQFGNYTLDYLCFK